VEESGGSPIQSSYYLSSCLEGLRKTAKSQSGIRRNTEHKSFKQRNSKPLRREWRDQLEVWMYNRQ
jgi:hypothetical protein